ncbi:MAG: energy transducer TonB [Gemmatimonadota bacterium]
MTTMANEPEPRGAKLSAMAATETANDRFKRRFGDWFWGSMIVATLFHFGLFLLWPTMTAADMGASTEEMESLDLPPEVEIPPPPQQISRPATPVIAEADVEEDITIAETTFEDNPIEDLPPPPSDDQGEDRFQQFTPSMVVPELRNRAEVQRELQRRYPPMLRDAGIEATVSVLFWIDEDGRVVRTEIQRSSGYERMDRAALDVADMMEYSPALNRDRRVAVVVAFPITFQVN